MKATIVIATKDRREDLAKALASAVRQREVAEIIVVDDGSADGTPEMVRRDFPQIRLECGGGSAGYIAARNRAARAATGDVIVSIDDDAEFSAPEVVAQTLEDFAAPNVGAVAIPYREPRKGNALKQRAPDDENVWMADRFIGTAHALRRELFLRLGGYAEIFVHQGEESDYCLRMLDAGQIVRLGRSDPVIHWESPRRDLRRLDFYGARNPVLLQWRNAPACWLPAALGATTWNCLKWTWDPPRLQQRVRGLASAYVSLHAAGRRPVKEDAYRHWRRLKVRGPEIAGGRG